MTTPDEFLSRVFAAADEVALRLAGTPPALQADCLERFAYSVHAQWSDVFASYLKPSDVDGMVIDVVERVRRRRDYLERFGRRTA
jgi:hypothetical protein